MLLVSFLKMVFTNIGLSLALKHQEFPEVQNLTSLHPKHHRTRCVGCYDVLIGFCWSST